MTFALTEEQVRDARVGKAVRLSGRGAGHDEWLTPPRILMALGTFDLDPCAPTVRPWPTARFHIAPPTNGLTAKWSGRVWLNPPFSQVAQWIGRLASHGDGIALVTARTSTRWFQDIAWKRAHSALFLRGKPRFFRVDGTPAASDIGSPVVLFAFGEKNARALAESALAGVLVKCLG